MGSLSLFFFYFLIIFQEIPSPLCCIVFISFSLPLSIKNSALCCPWYLLVQLPSHMNVKIDNCFCAGKTPFLHLSITIYCCSVSNLHIFFICFTFFYLLCLLFCTPKHRGKLCICESCFCKSNLIALHHISYYLCSFPSVSSCVRTVNIQIARPD